MEAQNSQKQHDTYGECYVSQENVFFQIHDDSIGTYIVEEHHGGEGEDRKEKEVRRGAVGDEGSTDRHKEGEKVEECR